MIGYEILNDLHPKKLTGIAIKKTQGIKFATDFLPERPFPEWSGYYKSWNNVGFGQLAPEVGESAPDELLNTDYTEESFTMKEYRIGGRISERAVNFLLSKNSSTHRSAGQALVQDEIEFLAETLALREEKTLIDAITGASGKTTAVTATNRWHNANGTPVANIRNAIKNIKEEWHAQPDTLLISPQAEMDLLTHNDIANIVKYNGSVGLGAQLITSPGISSGMPNLLGLKVYVSDVVTTDQIPTSGRTESRLVEDGYAVVFKRGSSLGQTFVAETMQIRRWAEEEYRSLRVQLFKTFVPVIYRPKLICMINAI